MKTFLTIVCSLFLFLNVSSQIKIKGRVLSVTNFEFGENNEHIIKKRIYPTQAFFHLSDSKFFVNGSYTSPVYKLFDKDTATLYGQLTISYYSLIKNELYIVGVSEIEGESDKIQLAIFPMSQPTKFTEFLLKISPKKYK